MSESDEVREDRVYVTLCIYHDDLDPEEVGRLLGSSPTGLRRKGHPAREGGRFLARTGAWFLESEAAVGSNSFEEHIQWLLDRLEGKDEEIVRLRSQGYKVEVSCFWQHVQLGPVLMLSPAVMKRLAELELLIWIDAYC